ncbi:MAG: dynamin family protein [Desulfobacter sp.]|nr:MAG: dynamin family protein [Desulfobacter sp.]
MTPPSLESIEDIVAETLLVIERLKSVPHGSDRALDEYQNLCCKIPDHIKTGLLRIAVVGVIKSGKSTFINALTKKELVKRGAGVVTSITTRIRKGKKNRACLYLKSWDEVNLVIANSLDMFPRQLPQKTFDIRRKTDRRFLKQVYEDLCREFPITQEGIRPETLVIKNGLEGYEACKDIIGAEERQICFEGKSFETHKKFTADPARAFYVNDVCLEVFGKAIDPNIEIADCQGADSTDPAQLSRIISYMESANLIMYCISSRTGLRRSDMSFLKKIKQLGLMENIIFINNCDLTEHDTLDDLNKIQGKIFEELLFLTPHPRLFSFSALYNLFDAISKKLTKKDAKRLSLWQEDSGMVKFCSQNTKDFFSLFNQLTKLNQFELLYANPIERLKIVIHALEKKANIIQDVLATDLEDQDRARAKLEGIEENARRLRVIVDNSIQGAVSGLSREIEGNLKQAFVRDKINQKITQFIKSAEINVEPYRSGIKETGFKQVLYLMFQDFKRQLDLFAIDEILPMIKTLVESQEQRIQDYFQSLMDSYQIDFFTLGSSMDEDARSYSIQELEKDPGNIQAVDINQIKKILGLGLPRKVFSPKFTTRMRANALTDFGFHSFALFISALVDKHVRFSFTPGFNKAADKIKKESLVLVRHQVKGYHQALRQDYFAPLIRAVTRDFKDKILQRFTLYESLNNEIQTLFGLKQDEKIRYQNTISSVLEKAEYIDRRLDQFSGKGFIS